MGGPTIVRDDLVPGAALLLALHPVDAGKTMLHSLLLAGDASPTGLRHAALAVRALRRDIEALAEAA